MRITLLQDVKGVDRHGAEFIRSTVRFSRGTCFEWRTGVEMDVSDTTGGKMIAAGQAREVKPKVAADVEGEA